MTLNLIENGDDADATKVMENLSVNLRATGINLISQLQDRTVTLPADGGIWGEAYIDATGRLRSVDTISTLTTATFDTDKYTTTASAVGYIYHTIPTGTFSATMSSMFATFKPENWEAGADVQYKLTGTAGAEDTGWLDTNEVAEFTAFTAEPDTCIVKLIPKTTAPQAGFPSINGFNLYGGRP